VNSGTNLNCGNTYPFLKMAVKKGLVTEEVIDSALRPLLKTRFKLGFFDPPEANPYNSISKSCINSNEHKKLARDVAAKSVVLLKNSNALPLKDDLRNIYVVGPHAASSDILLGNYYGASDELVTILEGIVSRVNLGTTVQYKHGFLEDRENVNPIDWTTGEAHDYEAIIITLGISGLLEGEEGDAIASTAKGDRLDLNLPKNQIEYLKKLKSKGDTPIIAVITGGSPITINEVYEIADAVVWVWYPGEQGGHAISDILFGDVNPSGRLPVTFPESTEQLPAYDDYSMEGRTYKFMNSKPLFPFGFGLSYTSFEYVDIELSENSIVADDTITASVSVKNTGDIAGDEIVQLYVTDLESSVRVPRYTLIGYQRVSLNKGQQKKITFPVHSSMLKVIDEKGIKFLEKGEFKLTAGGSSPGERATELGAANFATINFKLI